MAENLVTDRFLVYGTLRPGCGNYHHFFPYVNHEVETVRVAGLAMYGVAGFPYAVYGNTEDSIECSLITVTDSVEKVRWLQDGLDTLEGYNENNPSSNHYDRIKVEVEGGTAHIYVASDYMAQRHVLTLPRLESGNWYDVSPPRSEPYMVEVDDLYHPAYRFKSQAPGNAQVDDSDDDDYESDVAAFMDDYYRMNPDSESSYHWFEDTDYTEPDLVSTEQK